VAGVKVSPRKNRFVPNAKHNSISGTPSANMPTPTTNTPPTEPYAV
jgi:hypothetical protein